MRICIKEILYIFLFIVISFSFNVVHSPAKTEENKKNKLTPEAPRYELKLNLNEFSVFNSSVMGGLKKYGGGAEFHVRMGKEGEEIAWTVSIINPKLIEVLSYWTAEKSAELVDAIDVDNLDAKSKLALKTMKSVNEKVAYAQKNPVWDIVQISGSVIEDNEVLFMEGEQGNYQVTGNKLPELKKIKGKSIIVNGFIKVKDQIEVTKFLEKKENTLELFVMSLCPFAKMAESSILNFLKAYSRKPKPSLEIHYIFYKRKAEGEKMAFTSMHGEEEIQENLVQMVIRDEYPKFYHDYLVERVNEENAPWDRLAKQIGMKSDDIKSIEDKIESQRDTLLQKEYDYVTGTHGIYDGSPAYVWESERIGDIKKVEEFKGFKFSSGRCAEESEKEDKNE